MSARAYGQIVGRGIREVAIERLAPLPTRRLMLEAARVLDADGTETASAIAEAVRHRVATDGARPASALGYVSRSEALPPGWCSFELVSPEDAARAGLAILGPEAVERR